MNYLNASDVLPSELLKEIQKYAGGALLYVPKEEAREKTHEEVSDRKKYYKKRNRMMVNKFLYGTTVDRLSEEFCLSKDTVKKIVYSKKNTDELIFCPDTNSAKEYNDNELLEEWIHTYLLFVRKNFAFSEGLYEEDRFYLGPIAMPLQLFERNTGPEEGMKWKMHPEVFESRVSAWQEKIRNQQLLPPLIIGYADSAFEINCDNPLFEALIREGITYYPVIIWSTKECDYKEFLEKYSLYTKFVLK